MSEEYTSDKLKYLDPLVTCDAGVEATDKEEKEATANDEDEADTGGGVDGMIHVKHVNIA